MSNKEIEEELKKLNTKLNTLAKAWATTGLPNNLEEATKEVEKFIAYVEKVRPDVKKTREELKKRFPQLKDL